MRELAKPFIAISAALLIAGLPAHAVADPFVIDMQTEDGQQLAKTMGTDQFRYALLNSFSKNQPYSAVALSNSKDFKNGVVVYNAVIDPAENGARIIFTKFGDCGKPQITDAFIEVSDQPIKTLYECRAEASGSKVAIFLPVSAAAQGFVVKAFAMGRSVKVKLDKYAVVFATEGFQEVWSQKNKKAL